MTDEGYLKRMAAWYGQLSEAERTAPVNLYLYQPARAEYDVRFGGRKDARDIAALFTLARRQLGDGGITDGFYMLALADTVEKMDIQVYEHYRVLADLLLEAARAALGSQDPRVLCALMKGVRLGLLDPEKYLPAARGAFESAGPSADTAGFYQRALREYGRCME